MRGAHRYVDVKSFLDGHKKIFVANFSWGISQDCLAAPTFPHPLSHPRALSQTLNGMHVLIVGETVWFRMAKYPRL